MTINEFICYVKSERTNADPLLPNIIFDICCQATGTGMIQAMSRSRQVEAVFARQMAMFFIKIQRPRMSYVKIGEIVGDRDHSTVTHSIGVINDLIDPIYPGDFRRKWLKKAHNKLEHRLGKKINIFYFSQ
jgi:chromosomal replication initiation ATPase DnaA